MNIAIYKTFVSPYVAANTVLRIDFRHVEISENNPSKTSTSLFDVSSTKIVNVHTLVRTIIQASKDVRISGLVVHLDKFQATMTEMQEIRDAVVAFRTTGKKTMCYTSSFAESGSATLLYWFASAFEEIYMADFGTLSLVGLKFQPYFLRQMLDMVAAKPHLITRRRFKTMANMYMHDKFTGEHKVSTTEMMNAIYDHIVQEIAQSRGFSIETTQQLLEGGPYMASEAFDDKLVNCLAYEDEFYDSLLSTKFGMEKNNSSWWKIFSTSKSQLEKFKLMSINNYHDKLGSRALHVKGCTKIALINIIGTIHTGKSQTQWDGTEISAGSETIVRAINQASEDPLVKAILLRIASGGGSVVASEEITRAVREAKAAGKKVIASMAQYAASGGYYVACYADKIVASPLTITGSIGVVAGKINVRNTWAKLGVTFDAVQTSNNAHLNDDLESYNGENEDKLEAQVDHVYEKFKHHVAMGRNLSPERVEALAQGKVWMGTAAMAHGLVDVMGGMETALSVVKQTLHLKDKDTLNIVKYPAKNTRVLSSATILSWFLPASVTHIMSSFTLMVRMFTHLASQPQVNTIINTIPLCDFSNPSQVVIPPSCFISSDTDMSF